VFDKLDMLEQEKGEGECGKGAESDFDEIKNNELHG